VVEGVRDIHRFWVDLDHAEGSRATAVERRDSLEVLADKFPYR